MKCDVCGKTPAQGVTLIRQNPKGEKGVWLCLAHNVSPIDPEVANVVDALRVANR